MPWTRHNKPSQTTKLAEDDSDDNTGRSELIRFPYLDALHLRTGHGDSRTGRRVCPREPHDAVRPDNRFSHNQCAPIAEAKSKHGRSQCGRCYRCSAPRKRRGANGGYRTLRVGEVRYDRFERCTLMSRTSPRGPDGVASCGGTNRK
jgi:hypothetical protein